MVLNINEKVKFQLANYEPYEIGPQAFLIKVLISHSNFKKNVKET